ncbi:MAG: hypothetical protein ABSF52_06275 [Syntrophobacteraceae bacterium]
MNIPPEQAESDNKIIEFRNVGPDTTEAVSDVSDKIKNLAATESSRNLWRRLTGAITINPVPKLARVANWVADRAVEHASARIAVPKNDIEATLFSRRVRRSMQSG